MKKIISVIMCALLGLGAMLTGCGGNRGGDPNLITIGFAEAGYGREWLESAIKDFKDIHPEVRFELEGDPLITHNIQNRLETNTEVRDIFFGMRFETHKWAARGWLEPLDDLYETEVENGLTVEDKLEDYMDGYGRYVTKDGEHQYLLPWNSGASGIFYNAKMFREKGWEVPTTYQGLVDLCNTIVADEVNDDADLNNDISPFSWGGTITSYWDFLVQTWWVQLVGTEAYREFLKFESPEVYNPSSPTMAALLKATQAFEDLIVKKPQNSVPACASKDHITMQMDFINGRSAMVVCGAWLENEMRANIPEDFEMALMPTPFMEDALKDDDGEYIPVNFTVAGDYAIIPAAAQNKELAKEFLVFMLREEQLQKYLLITGSPRPFKFTLPELDTLTPCTQGIINIINTSTNVCEITNNQLAIVGRANVWALGDIYRKLLTGTDPGYTAATYFNEAYSFVTTEWDSWLLQAGMK